ncbi:MAG: GMC family oxidoreductase N-terminal domain-containing protein [Ktedonobacterales bacterium]
MATEQQSSSATAAVNWLTPTQMRTLEAICEALAPPVPPPDGEADLYGLYARSARDLPVAQLICEALALDTPENRRDFQRLLGTLNSPLAGMVLAGRPQGFAQLSLAARETALRKMSTSSRADLRQGFQAVKRLALFLFYAAPGEDGHNPNWPALGYERPPLPPPAEAVPKPIHPLSVTAPLTLSADAVIVGSGAGGGVMAAELSAAGKDVIVLEKGGYYNEPDFTGLEAEMTRELYLRHGTLSTADLGMVVLAGSALGGGTLVNWSTSLRTPEEVLFEWEREHGLSGATSSQFAAGFDFAEARLGVNTEDSAPNPNNSALQHGCEALAYQWKPIPRNASGCQQRCGACGYGCQFGRKQSTLLTFLQDASDRGARFVVRCQVDRVLIEAGRVTGVEGWALDETGGARHRVVVRAPLVVISGGSVESPALLLRSGLSNRNIGRHLRLHPVSGMAGLYAEPIQPWKGSLQTVYSPQFAHLRENYGIRLEVMPAHPGTMGLFTPWENAQSHKQLMAQLGHMATFIVLTRDTGEGQITLDRHGEPVIQYWPNQTDRKHLTRGLQELTRIIFAGGGIGAISLHTPPLQLESEGRKPGAVSPEKLDRYLAELEARGIVANRVGLGTAHQMGTCRLGADPRTAVADPSGQVYGVSGLYIADASGFPSASGVNPMLSTMALSYWVAQQVKA